MSKKDVYDYLDNGGHLPSDPESRELLSLLREVEEVDVPDPGQAYWNQFNRRLHARIDAEAVHKRGWRHWLTLPVWAGVAAVLVIGFLAFRQPAVPPDSSVSVPSENRPLGIPDTPLAERRAATDLGALDNAGLEILAEFFEAGNQFAYDEEGNDEEVYGRLEVLGDGFFDQEDYSGFDSDSFKEIWSREG